jgi:hypothetical protein
VFEATLLDIRIKPPHILWRCITIGTKEFSEILDEEHKVKLLITNNAFYIVQTATAQSKTGFFRDYGVAEAPSRFQAGWSDCMYFSISFCSF